MSSPLSALRAGVSALLEAQGEPDLAALVRQAEVELVDPEETWWLGARAVVAHRVSVCVGAEEYAVMLEHPEQLARLREAFQRAVRSPETELAELVLVLSLPGVRGGWRCAYRTAPVRREIECPHPSAVLGGAIALLQASGELEAAALLERAELERSEVPGCSTPLSRYVLRVDPRDWPAVERGSACADRARRALLSAATRAAERVASVELAVALGHQAGHKAPATRRIGTAGSSR